MPERLTRFHIEDWPELPTPNWWEDGPASWRYFKARLTWQRELAAHEARIRLTRDGN
jgi:hypothetical protein